MARLYANENFPLPVVERLRLFGHDVLTILEAGYAGLAVPDAEVLERATADSRAILTLNRKHFIKLHGQKPEHCGIVVCTFDIEFEAQAARIHEALLAAGRLERQLIRVNRPAV